ncbi:hypothetical protein ABZ313_35525 [Streptomyces sp. NPDC006251]|uniref:hypothetical protein n=1 Tax=Streptomyces sp. NPDC006251 TaxID=3155718 RepID=UPI0033BD5D5E
MDLVLAACERCRGFAEAWWRCGIADDKTGLRAEEFAFYEHLVDTHPKVRLTGVEGCRSCQEVQTMAQFALPGMAMHRADGSYVDPVQLHFVHHVLERTAEICVTGTGAATMTSRHGFTAYLYHLAAGGGPADHVCSPDRGHPYDVTVELTTPVTLTSEDQTHALRVVVAELERDLQYRELERLGADETPAVTVADRFDLARWVHATIGRRLADGMDQYLRVRVEATAEGAGTAVFPPT